MIENDKYGVIFKEIRTNQGFKAKDLATVVPVATLSEFENGKRMLSADKISQALELMGFSLADFEYLTNPKKKVFGRYGELFHEIREQRGYSECYFISLGVSSYRLQLFEEGKIMLGYDIVDAMLQEMHVTEDDFSHHLNKGQDDEFVEIFNRIEQAYYKNDVKTLKQIEMYMNEYAQNIEEIEKEQNKREKVEDYPVEMLTRQFSDYRMIALSAKSCYTTLEDKEKEEVADFLMGVDIWTRFTLAVFAAVVMDLEYATIRTFLQEFWKEEKLFEDNIHYRNRILQAAVKAVFAVISKGRGDVAVKILDFSKGYLKETDDHSKAIYKFAQGYERYAVHGNEEGGLLMQKVIEHFEFLEDISVAGFYRQIYLRYVK